MIVNLRGTSGSGKSTLVRRVMEKYPTKQPVYIDWRRQPLGYLLYADNHRPLWVPGHYETACGGCDTLPTIDFTYGTVNKYAPDCDIIYEGLIVQSDVTRCIDLHKAGHKLLVVALNTPLEECFASIQARRDSRGDTRPLSTKNTVAKNRALGPQALRFKDAGVDFRFLNREEGFQATLEAFGWPS